MTSHLIPQHPLLDIVTDLSSPSGEKPHWDFRLKDNILTFWQGTKHFVGQFHLDSGRLVCRDSDDMAPVFESPFGHVSYRAENRMTGEQSFILPMGWTIRLAGLKITWKAGLKNLHSWLREWGMNNNMAELALAEALGNIFRHSSARTVSVTPMPSVNDTPNAFILEDDGVAFNPLTATSQSDGVGLNLIRDVADLDYERRENTNILTLSFTMPDITIPEN